MEKTKGAANEKHRVVDEEKSLQVFAPKMQFQASPPQELSINGKPGCIYVRTHQHKGESYVKILRYVKGGSNFTLTSLAFVWEKKLTAQNKKEADRLFDTYLAELKTTVK